MERRGRWDKWREGEGGISGELEEGEVGSVERRGRWDKWRGGGGGISGEKGKVG